MYPLKVGCRLMIVGSSESGKSSIARKLIQYKKEMWVDDEPSKVIFCYTIWQPLYQEMMVTFPFIVFKFGLPSREDLEAIIEDKDSHSLLFFDDMIGDLFNDNNIEKLITGYSHHSLVSVVSITQNIYYRGKNAKTMTLNHGYFIFLASRVDVSQIKKFGYQVMGSGKPNKAFYMAYLDTQKELYNYLFCDLSPSGNRNHTLRSSIFPDEEPTIIYRVVE
jgi:hypothetical protein